VPSRDGRMYGTNRSDFSQDPQVSEVTGFLEQLQAKWIRSAAENVQEPAKRAEVMTTETARAYPLSEAAPTAGSSI
jgi:hypothetical protein